MKEILVDSERSLLLENSLVGRLPLDERVKTGLVGRVLKDNIRRELEGLFENQIFGQLGYETLVSHGLNQTRVVVFLLRYVIFLDNRQDGFKSQSDRIANAMGYAEGGIRVELSRILTEIGMFNASEGAVFNWARQEGIIDRSYIPDVHYSE